MRLQSAARGRAARLVAAEAELERTMARYMATLPNSPTAGRRPTVAPAISAAPMAIAPTVFENPQALARLADLNPLADGAANALATARYDAEHRAVVHMQRVARGHFARGVAHSERSPAPCSLRGLPCDTLTHSSRGYPYPPVGPRRAHRAPRARDYRRGDDFARGTAGGHLLDRPPPPVLYVQETNP